MSVLNVDWEEMFVSSSWLEQHHSIKVAHRKNFIESLNIDCHSCILDVGCGTGSWTSVIAELCPTAEILGIDTSTKNIEYASDQCSKFGSRVKFLLADACNTLEPSNSFDRIFMFNSLSYFSSRSQLFLELARVAKVGCTLVIRHFDDQLIEVGPLASGLMARLISRAEYRESSVSNSMNFFGRTLSNNIRIPNFKTHRSYVDYFCLSFPFSAEEKDYIRQNIRYLCHRVGEQNLDEVVTLLRLVDDDLPVMFLSTEGYYKMGDYVIEMERV